MIRKRKTAAGVTRYKVLLNVRDDRGKTVQLSGGTWDTLAEAKSAERSLAGRGSAAAGDDRGGTFGALLDEWQALGAQTWSPANRANTKRVVDQRIRPALGAKKTARITTRDLDRYFADLADRGLAPATIKRTHAIISSAFALAVDYRTVAENPAVTCTRRLPKLGRRKIKAPTTADVVRVLNATNADDPDLGAFLHLSITTGARRGELCALRWSDLDFDQALCSIDRAISEGDDGAIEGETKTGATRRIYLDPTAVDVLKTHRVRCAERSLACGVALPADGFVFSHEPDGSRCWLPHSVTTRFRYFRTKVDATFRLHDLRHYNVTQLIAAGIDLTNIAARVGHSGGGRTTQAVYAHALQDRDEAAANVIGGVLAKGLAKASGS